MCSKASDLTYNLNIVSYQLSILEAHQEQKKFKHFYRLAEILL